MSGPLASLAVLADHLDASDFFTAGRVGFVQWLLVLMYVFGTAFVVGELDLVFQFRQALLPLRQGFVQLFELGPVGNRLRRFLVALALQFGVLAL